MATLLNRNVKGGAAGTLAQEWNLPNRSADQSNPSSSALCHHLSHLPELTIYREPPGFKSAVKEKLRAGRLWETDSLDLSQAMGFHHANRKIQ